MARANNKYASLNFNDIYEKKITTPTTTTNNNKIHPSSSPTKTILSHSRIHGNMLVLTRPSPKPTTLSSPQPQPKQQSVPTPSPSDQARFDPEDAISLRPLGRTGAGPIGSPLVSSPIKQQPLSVSPKSDKFVPPHLRPGFLGREEKPAVPEFQKQFVGGGGGAGVRVGNRQGVLSGSPNFYGEERRPKSGGGYERMRRGFEADPLEVNRPGSSGARPSSSG